MAKLSLHAIGQDAAALYSNHRVHTIRSRKSDQSRSPVLELTDFDREVGITEPYDHYTDFKVQYDANIRVAAEYTKDNIEQLHDLAVLEAHIGGVAINVEQPIVVGQKAQK